MPSFLSAAPLIMPPRLLRQGPPRIVGHCTLAYCGTNDNLQLKLAGSNNDGVTLERALGVHV